MRALGSDQHREPILTKLIYQRPSFLSTFCEKAVFLNLHPEMFAENLEDGLLAGDLRIGLGCDPGVERIEDVAMNTKRDPFSTSRRSRATTLLFWRL